MKEVIGGNEERKEIMAGDLKVAIPLIHLSS
jgi:hypothetical protein